MRISRKPRSERPRNQDGVSVVFVALLLVVLLGMAALAVDMGLLMAARTEAQRVADSAALAGAGVYTGDSSSEGLARSTAQHFASLNDIRNVAAVVDPDEDVEFVPANRLVRVRVHRTAARDNPMTNVFARAIGIDTTDVSTVAAARWNPTGGANCMLPVCIPDRWWEGIAPGVGDSESGPWPTMTDVFDPANDVYEPLFIFNEDGEIIDGPNEPHSSYNESARGTEIRLKTNSPCQGGEECWFPATYFAIRFPGDDSQPGADVWAERIKGCPEPDLIWYPGQLVDQEPGDMVGKTNEGFKELIDQAPDQYWASSGPGVPAGGCVWDPNRPGGAGCIPDYESPRTRVLPMFDPREFPDNPSVPFRITSFVGVFVDGFQGSGHNAEIIGRFVNYRGAEALPPGSDDVPVLGQILQLVE